MQRRPSKEFVKKLYDIIEDTNNEQYILWNDNGTSFIIIDPTTFTNNILQNFFRHKRMSSFVRQLNKYDFHKKKSTKDVINKFGSQILEYEHMFFQKGKRNQLYRIRRKNALLDPPSAVSDLLPGVESNYLFQNHMVFMLKDMSEKFDILIENVNSIKTAIVNQNKIVKKSVLIYDEDRNMAFQMFTLLKNKNIDVILVESKNCLVSTLQISTFDFIIFGARLPACTEIMKYIRNYNATIPVIYTGYDATEKDIVNLEITEYINRPFTYCSFFSVVNKYLNT